MVTIEYREAAGRSSAMRSKNIINGFTAFYNYFSYGVSWSIVTIEKTKMIDRYNVRIL